jgi:hypothetical protein
MEVAATGCPATRSQRRSSSPRKVRAKTLISALGLKTTKAHESISTYSGNYLLFTLDPDSNVVVTSIVLSQELGDDRAPIYKARRRVTRADTINFVGAYFANEHQLYLVGTPRGSVELLSDPFTVIKRVSASRAAALVVKCGQRIFSRQLLAFQCHRRLTSPTSSYGPSTGCSLRQGGWTAPAQVAPRCWGDRFVSAVLIRTLKKAELGNSPDSHVIKGLWAGGFLWPIAERVFMDANGWGGFYLARPPSEPAKATV